MSVPTDKFFLTINIHPVNVIHNKDLRMGHYTSACKTVQKRTKRRKQL